jgi:hypothetical protein
MISYLSQVLRHNDMPTCLGTASGLRGTRAKGLIAGERRGGASDGLQRVEIVPDTCPPPMPLGPITAPLRQFLPKQFCFLRHLAKSPSLPSSTKAAAKSSI